MYDDAVSFADVCFGVSIVERRVARLLKRRAESARRKASWKGCGFMRGRGRGRMASGTFFLVQIMHTSCSAQ